METPMFCFQCQETKGNTGCTTAGKCGKHAETSNLMDELIAHLKALSLTLENRPHVTREFSRYICRAMFATITNANFSDSRIQSLIDEAKRALFMLDSKQTVPPPGVLACADEDVRSLRELLIYGLKGICAYAMHANALGFEDNRIYNFVIKALAAATKDSIGVSELKKLVFDCGNVAAITMAVLDEANTETYGSPRITKVKTSVGTNPGILVTGHDLKDLEELLIQTEGKGIDIYTHGEMLPAHYYPMLKKYPHLVGNYGSSWWKQGEEFASFNGVILVTTNCIVPVKEAYKDRIFTTGMAGYPGVPHITHRHVGCQKDFSSVIEAAKKYPPPTQLEDIELVGGFAHEQVCAVADKIAAAVRKGDISRFIVMAGCDGRDSTREYFTRVAEILPKNTVILTAGCAKYRYNKLGLGDINGIPRVLDAGQCNDSYSLVRIALRLREEMKAKDVNELPISFDLAWYEQKAVAVLLALLALGFRNIRLGPTLPAFLSPNVAAILVRDYDIKLTSTPEADVEAMMKGE